MKNAVVYPFERNRYYPGKMLTSADFSVEQNYINNKRRFVNNLMFGGGIVCGLGVVSLDDLSIMVESGVAMDASGREIVVDVSQVKKLSAIEGFEQLTSDEALLCVKYEENEIHTVYSPNMMDGAKDFEYNRISETARIFLKDNEDTGFEFADTEFLTCADIVTHKDFKIEAMMPATVSKGRNVRLIIKVTKLSSEDTTLTFHGVIQVPAFIAPDGSHEIRVDMDDVSLREGEVLEFPYWMRAVTGEVIDTTILLKSGTPKAYVDDRAIPVDTSFSLNVKLSKLSPRDLVIREIGRISLEMKSAFMTSDYIPLALFKLVRTESAYIIESVIESGIKKYISAPSQDALRESYMEYFVKDVDIFNNKGNAVSRTPVPMGDGDSMPKVATGILEIPLGENPRTGDIKYSGEITHGLGRGNVYVDIGYEFVSDDPALGANAKSTVYGNPELFAKQMPNKVDAEIAVKVLNDKGSFVAAVRLLEPVDYLVLTYRWVAIRFPAGNDLGLVENFEDKSISAQTPTVVLATKESHFFGVNFHNMPTCSIAYELTEAGSGEITSDGIYTAPSREGVYEIRIYCTDMPLICTYAYAIVKKKEFTQEEEKNL